MLHGAEPVECFRLPQPIVRVAVEVDGGQQFTDSERGITHCRVREGEFGECIRLTEPVFPLPEERQGLGECPFRASELSGPALRDSPVNEGLTRRKSRFSRHFILTITGAYRDRKSSHIPDR
ncbi:hypothetical protein GCM10010404_32450 [Nonomuraea africana]